jgi:hypothetical protein
LQSTESPALSSELPPSSLSTTTPLPPVNVPPKPFEFNDWATGDEGLEEFVKRQKFLHEHQEISIPDGYPNTINAYFGHSTRTMPAQGPFEDFSYFEDGARQHSPSLYSPFRRFESGFSVKPNDLETGLFGGTFDELPSTSSLNSYLP